MYVNNETILEYHDKKGNIIRILFTEILKELRKKAKIVYDDEFNTP